MSHDQHSKIEHRARAIWEREGRPEGHAEAHWQRAQEEIAREAAEAEAEQEVKSFNIFRCSGRVGRYNELGWNVGLTEATGDQREQE